MAAGRSPRPRARPASANSAPAWASMLPAARATVSDCCASASFSCAKSGPGGGSELLAQGGHQLGDSHPHLLHAVPLADGHGLVLEAVKVDGHGERGPDLIMPAIAAPDRLRLVVLDPEVRPQQLLHLTRGGQQLLILGEWQHRHLDRRDAGMEAEDDARLTTDLLFVVGIDHQGEQAPIHAHRGLDDIWQGPLPGLLLEGTSVLSPVPRIPPPTQLGPAAPS